MAPRETENNAYAKFGGDEQRTLWYVMVFSGVVNWKLFMFYLKIVSSYSGSIESAVSYYFFSGLLPCLSRLACLAFVNLQGKIRDCSLSTSPRSKV